MNTTTRFTIVDDFIWLTERIILAGEQLLNPSNTTLKYKTDKKTYNNSDMDHINFLISATRNIRI